MILAKLRGPSDSTTARGHRPSRCAFAPENTIEAIVRASSAGAMGVEVDVQLSADGQLVIAHDDHVLRCTDARRVFPERAPWLVCGLTLSELQSLDAGSWYTVQLHTARDQRQEFLQSLTDKERDAEIAEEDLAHFSSGAVRIP